MTDSPQRGAIRHDPDGRSYQWTGIVWMPLAQQPSAPQARKGDVSALGPFLGCAGAVAVIIGTLLPWVSALTPFGTFSAKGLDTDDGKLALGVGIALFVCAAAMTTGNMAWRILTFLAGAAALGIAIYDGGRAQRAIGQANRDAAGFGRLSVGAGLYLIGVGGAVAVVAALATRRRRF